MSESVSIVDVAAVDALRRAGSPVVLVDRGRHRLRGRCDGPVELRAQSRADLGHAAMRPLLDEAEGPI